MQASSFQGHHADHIAVIMDLKGGARKKQQDNRVSAAITRAVIPLSGVLHYHDIMATCQNPL
jgi:hypothetical protein